MKDLNLKEPRFRIVHNGLATPAVQKRMRELHLLADSNPAFVYWIGAYFSNMVRCVRAGAILRNPIPIMALWRLELSMFR